MNTGAHLDHIDDLMREAAEQRAAWAAQAGLPGIAKGAQIEWDADGITRRGAFERIAPMGRGRRIEYLLIVVREMGGELSYQQPEAVRRSAGPSLPACRRFAGTGRRCTTCKIHRNIHD